MSTVPPFQHPTSTESFSAGQTVFGEGQPGDKMYVVKEGEVELVAHGKILDTVGRGGIVGEMALIDKKYRSATAIAKTDCLLVPVDENHFTSLVQKSPGFALQVMRVLAERLRRMDERI
jgi:CRP-like cAMP-binding protein